MEMKLFCVMGFFTRKKDCHNRVSSKVSNVAQNTHGMLNRAELTLSAAGHRKEPEQKEACPGTSSNAGDNLPKGENR